jgi:hypothetical protein
MKCGAEVFLSFAVASFALLGPQPARALGAHSSSAPMNPTLSSARHEAMEMIPVETSLERNLDARKDKPGVQFQVRLRETAHLKNGPELPNGTTLIGTVTADRMNAQGTSRFALRFTEARLKDGRTIPIRATIMDVSRPENGFGIDPGTEAAQTWRGKALQVDQIGALSGVDLHSRIGARNSGVFVSRKKDNMKFSAGTQLTLAIAAKKAA